MPFKIGFELIIFSVQSQERADTIINIQILGYK